MRQITWNLQIERGARNSTFSGQAIKSAMAWISRYWAVDFVQVSRNPWMRFLLTNQRRNASWAAWTSGRTIHIPAWFHYRSFVQQEFVFGHEMGHVFAGGTHSPRSEAVMYEKIVDIQKNFAATDANWFRFNWRGPLRPWHEPDYRRAYTTTFDEENCEVGCESWSIASLWHSLVTRTEVSEVADA